jgi:stringent starvation protein B
MSTSRLPPKKDVALALLESSAVFVHLDPRDEQVRVPPWFKKQPQLVLQVGLNMPVPIPDLNLDEQGVSCTLSFNRTPHFCHVPWMAVYALVGEDGRGMVWPEDVPPEVAAQAQAHQKKAEQRAHLRAVPAGEAKAEVSPDQPKAAKKKRAKKPKLAAVDGKPVAKRKARKKASEAGKADVAPDAENKAGKRKLPPYLRVVK